MIGLLGLVVLYGAAWALSTRRDAVSLRLVAWGFGLQLAFALLILRTDWGAQAVDTVGEGVRRLLAFADMGSLFVFGEAADPAGDLGMVFAFRVLPIVIFISSLFSVLYYMGIMQRVVLLMAKGMHRLMGVSGSESLAAAANVFMGQTEAPIIVKPYIARMTQSELLTLMTGGLATIAGSVLGVYISLGADPVAILTTSVMAAPCGLYLSKILMPETETPETAGAVTETVRSDHANVIDAAAGGAADGMRLAINVAAMLIAFLAFIAMLDALLGLISPGLSLARVFAVAFAPIAVLLGVTATDVPALADLLGTKLVTNEFVAYVKLAGEYEGVISERSRVLATFALTGFANFGSIGILLGGIGGIAPERRADLARLSMRALLAGFCATLINASIAAILI